MDVVSSAPGILFYRPASSAAFLTHICIIPVKSLDANLEKCVE